MAIELEITALPWLEKLLSITTFFSICNVHHPSVCNKYCLDCNEKPLCHSCTKTPEHKDHRVIQIRRSSYNVVKATDIQDHVNINGIHKYMINGSKVVFLNKRFHYNGNLNLKMNSFRFTCNCRVCNRSLVESSDFCSLECKLEWVKVNGTFVIRAREDSEETAQTSSSPSSNEKNDNVREGTPKRQREEEEEEEKGKEENKEEVESVIPRQVSFRRPNSKRKGIPHRAPFF